MELRWRVHRLSLCWKCKGNKKRRIRVLRRDLCLLSGIDVVVVEERCRGLAAEETSFGRHSSALLAAPFHHVTVVQTRRTQPNPESYRIGFGPDKVVNLLRRWLARGRKVSESGLEVEVRDSFPFEGLVSKDFGVGVRWAVRVRVTQSFNHERFAIIFFCTEEN